MLLRYCCKRTPGPCLRKCCCSIRSRSLRRPGRLCRYAAAALSAGECRCRGYHPTFRLSRLPHCSRAAAIERRRGVRKAASASIAHASQFPHPSAFAAQRKTADGLFGTTRGIRERGAHCSARVPPVAAALDGDDAIRRSHGREPVRDDQNRSPLASLSCSAE
jgi:hypothetical protein